jgi:acetyl-CoA carboxylase carboxyltransferase component
VAILRLIHHRFDAIRKAREWVLTTSAARFQLAQTPLIRESIDPNYDAEDLLGIINPDIRQPLDMMDVLLRIVDASRMEIFKPTFGNGMITAWAHIHGIESSIFSLKLETYRHN